MRRTRSDDLPCLRARRGSHQLCVGWAELLLFGTYRARVADEHLFLDLCKASGREGQRRQRVRSEP